jgi:recombination protein RecT
MNKTPVAQLQLELGKMRQQFLAVLPKHIPEERFARTLLTAINNNPDLLNVHRGSLWNAAMKAAQDGLLPDGRFGAIVVYKDKRRGPIAQWLPMVAGIRQKVRNSGEVSTWEVHTVHEKDLFDFELGDSPRIVHRPARGSERGKIIAAYSIAVLKTGDISREVMWIDEIEKIKEASRAGEAGPWKTHYGEMVKKTVAKRHAKVLPMSSDLDDLLRQGDDDEDGEIAAPKREGGRDRLTDALDALAPPAGDQVPMEPEENQTDLIEHIADKEAADHGT